MHRGLKGRTKGRPTARRPVRKVPIPPELVELLRTHLETFGTAPDGGLFRSESGNPIQPSTWWQVWQKVRTASLTPEQLATPLMKRPYDLRHSGVTWRLNSGVPATEVAAWAGHSVEMLKAGGSAWPRSKKKQHCKSSLPFRARMRRARSGSGSPRSLMRRS